MSDNKKELLENAVLIITVLFSVKKAVKQIRKAIKKFKKRPKPRHLRR